MPIYDYTCPVCGDVLTDIRKYIDRENLPFCHKCEVPMEVGMTAGKIIRGKKGMVNK